jgi:hypothetical protein
LNIEQYLSITEKSQRLKANSQKPKANNKRTNAAKAPAVFIAFYPAAKATGNRFCLLTFRTDLFSYLP